MGYLQGIRSAAVQGMPNECPKNTESIRAKVKPIFRADTDKREEELDGFACRMVQHEMDHLDGHLFVDRVAPIRRKMIAAKLHNIAKGKARTAYKTKLER